MKFLKRFSLFEAALVAVILAIHLYAALADAYNFPNVWFKRDDAYYYFKVAQNISEGYGSAFDGINLTNGYHPLWMIVCVPIFALARFDVILPLRVLLMVAAGFHAASAILIYRLVKENLSQAVAILAASFWAFNFYIHATVYRYGLETPVAALAVLYLIYKLSMFEKEWRAKPVTTRQLVEIALAAALAMFGRLDLVFLAAIAGVWVIFRGRVIRYLLPLDVFIIFASMTSSVAFRTGIDSYNTLYASSTLEAVMLALAAKLTALYFFGAYQHPRANTIWKNFRQTFLALTTSSVFITAMYLLLAQFGAGGNFPRSAFLLDWTLSLLLIFALRLAATWFSSDKAPTQESPFSEFKANWKNWLTEGFTYYGIFGGLLALYMLFNKIMFGTSSPVSGQIKRWWGSMANTVYERPASNWYSFFGISTRDFIAWNPATGLFSWLAKMLLPIIRRTDMDDERYYISMLVFIMAGLILAFANKRRALHIGSKLAFIPLLAGSGIHILSYSATSYGGVKEWYWVSQMILITLAGSFYLDLILRPLLRIKFTRLTLQTIAIAVFAILAYNLNDFIATTMRHDYYDPNRPHMEVLQYLETNTPPGSIIGMTGGGNVGYFIRGRTIVNMDGLINSHAYFQALQNGTAPAYLREHGMTIIFANPQLLALPPYFDQFAPYLERYNNYGGKGLFYLLEEPKY